ncbi:glycine betaine transporter [Peptoclostridium litorale DSM 5388]|uniref:Glycine betaine transporter GrdT n=1 Tax=Peptoclostridium litorale DSM 5388 TaxID=1121324 RepID=A0A069RCG1_PEPLI|nr:BCCT family transporter [Peptoclostridium litorale]KDR94734.1 glycine betaine transporter GrdT [Peptoclostridium litorale DSM 5388]SIO33327.1 glycine betaine transporter [Peptoclostridium litorale DSM 5388]
MVDKIVESNMAKKPDNTVFYASMAIVIAIVGWGLAAQASFATFADNLLAYLSNTFGWAYLLAMFVFVVFAAILAFSKYGDLKLGPDDSTPDFSTKSWFAMLFGAGMGIGLVFWGVAEPIYHYLGPVGAEAGTPEAVDFAFKTSFKHWGFHPWANYSIIGLALAYMQFRKGKPGLISSIFIPLVGDKAVQGVFGKTVDILAVFATVAGVATSLGMGTLQIGSGISYIFGVEQTMFMNLMIIAVVTVIFIWTAVSGVDKGIKVLGDINLVLAGGLLVGTFLVGNKVATMNGLSSGLGLYLNDFLKDSLSISAFGDNSWLSGWTVFYWAWWIAWAPFVGSFIARISRGRTIREFIGGVIFAPAMASFIWFAVFGSLGLNLFNNGTMTEIGAAETALFEVMQHYPLGTVLSFITLMLLCTFFITSANSATFVLGMLTSEGDLNPSNQKKIIWGLFQSLLATALLLAGGLKSLQTISVAAAFPFIFVMFLAIASFMKALVNDEKFAKK